MTSVLPCGRDADRLVAQVFDGATPTDPEHQAGCPHCRAALARLEETRRGLGRARAERVTVPATLARDVLARVRSTGSAVSVDASPRGATLVGADVVAEIAQRAALAVEGVAYASVVVTDAVETGVVALRIRLVIEYGPAAAALVAAVRAAVEAALDRLAGAMVRRIDVAIDDLAR